MSQLDPYLPRDRRLALAAGEDLPQRSQGTVLFADISGFTPLTEALTRSLGPRRGVEELTRQLNLIYNAILAPVEAYGGTVLSYAGDAALCFFAAPAPGAKAGMASTAAAATRAAFGMQDAMRAFDAVPLPDGTHTRIALKVALASGPVTRLVVGDPNIRRIDTLSGATVARAAVCEHFCSSGEIWMDAATAAALGERVQLCDRATDPQTGDYVRALSFTPEADSPPPPIPEPAPLSPELLRPWLHPFVAERLTAGEGEFLTELRPLVSLFAHFGGLDYDADPEVGAKLSRLIVRAQQILARYDGQLLEITIGDKGSYFYAAFGAIAVHEDDMLRAVHAARELIALPAALELEPFQIGISQGIMLVGPYGSATRRTFGAQGDEVNLAARLMMQARPGQLLVSGRLQSALAADFDLEPLPPIRLKGKAEPLLPFLVKGLSRARDARLQEPEYDLPLIGREAELDQLKAALDRAERGEGQSVGVTAPAGMGKSRLVGELVRRARRSGQASFVGECQSFGLNTSYLVWIPIWRAFFNIDPALAPRRLVRALEGELEDLAPDRMDSLPLLSAVLDVPLPENAFTTALEPEFRKSALDALLVRCIQSAAALALTQDRALIFVLEDVHWIDPASRELLEQLASAIATLPVLILLTYRPPDGDTSATFHPETLPHFSQITLPELSPAQGESLIRALLARFAPENTAPVPPELIELLLQRSEGNPFYLQELLSYLHDRGLNPRDPASLEREDLPGSLHRLILSRMDHLASHQQLTLKVASVIGRAFPLAHLAGYYPHLGSQDDVRADLSRLTQTELILPDPAASPEIPAYLFKHILTQQVAYESLAHDTRSMLHTAYGRFLEAHSVPDQALDLLAFHYDRGDDFAKRLEYLERAGRAAAARYANASALDYLTRALALTPPDRPAARCALLTVREHVYDVRGDREPQARDLAELEQLASAVNEPATHAEALLRRGWLATQTAYYAQAVASARETIALLESSSLTDTERDQHLSEAYALWGEALAVQGEAAAARPHVAKSLALARSVDGRAAVARALDRLGAIARELGDPRAAIPLHTEALELARALGDRRREWSALNNLALSERNLGQSAQAIVYYDQALRVVRDIGDRLGEGMLLNNLSQVYLDVGDPDRAFSVLEQVLAIARAIGDRRRIAHALINLSEAHRIVGSYGPARDYSRRALDLAREIGDRVVETTALCNLGAIAFEQGDSTGALDLLASSVAIAHAIPYPFIEAFALNLIGHAHLALATADAPPSSHTALAADTLDKALALWRTLPDSPEILRAYAGVGALALARSDETAVRSAADSILAYLDAHPGAASDPAALAASLALYRLLTQLRDPRAGDVLQRALARLKANADKIENAAHRQSYLNNISAHAALLELGAKK